MNAFKLPLLGVSALLVLAAGCRRELSHAAPATSSAAPAVSLPAASAPFATPPVLPGTPDVAALVARVKPSVVNIMTEHEVKLPRFDPGDPFGFDPFEGFFGRPRIQRPPIEQRSKQRSLGSGFVVDASGHVVTNAHVIEGASSVRVKLADDRELSAKVKGKDPRLDLAVLEIEGANDVPAAALGSSEALRVGEYVVAIGNPFGLGHTVTMGIVSAKSRTIGAGPYDDFIQTDASINPGNSGGPLFNLRGEVVGINTAINPNGRGIGFAIPADALKEVIPQLLARGHVERGRLGVAVQPVDAPIAKAMGLDRPRGALVAEVERDGPAARAGLRSGDVIASIDGADVPSSQDLPRLVARHAPGTKVSVKVLRGGDVKTIDVVLDALQDEEAPKWTSDRARAAPRLGAELRDVPGRGVLVERVAPRSAAEQVLRPGDLIVEVDRAPVTSAPDASSRIARALKSGPVLLRIERDGKGRYVAIDPSATP